MTSRLSWRRLCVLAVAAVVAALVLVWQLPRPARSPFTRLDPTLPYRIEFGRGSGLCGLDTIEVLHDGTVTLHRLSREAGGCHVEKTALRLPERQLARVLDAVEECRLLHLEKMYSDPLIQDGTQWVLWIQQGDQEKSVYFDNRFPEEIDRFATRLDRILAESGLPDAAWQRATDGEALTYDRELWASIHR